jgi:HAD superfamily hydrolase (TIGR01450 family)
MLHDSLANRCPLRTVDEWIEHYDGVLFDAYGVLVDGTGVLPGANDLLQHLTAIEKPWLIITNAASDLPTTLAARFAALGLSVAADKILTSGSLLHPYFIQHGLQGARCCVLGPQQAQLYAQQAGGQIIASSSLSTDIDVLIIADQQGIEWPTDVDHALTCALARLDQEQPIHLLVCNPDLIYPLGAQRFGVTAGALAALFERIFKERYPHKTIEFTRLGKPHSALFSEAQRRLGVTRPVMIGDQLETDIRGAFASGMDALLVTSGLAPRYTLSDWPLLPTGRIQNLLRHNGEHTC